MRGLKDLKEFLWLSLCFLYLLICLRPKTQGMAADHSHLSQVACITGVTFLRYSGELEARAERESHATGRARKNDALRSSLALCLSCLSPEKCKITSVLQAVSCYMCAALCNRALETSEGLRRVMHAT